MNGTLRDRVASAFDSNFGLSGTGRVFLEDVDLRVDTLSKGAYAHHAGDDIDTLYVVLDGWLTTTVEREDGRRQLIDFHVPVDLTGLEFTANREASSSLRAFEDSRICRIPVQQFTDALPRHPDVALAVLRTLSSGYSALQQQMAVFIFSDARAKIAQLLIGLKAKQDRNLFSDPDILRLPLTQQDIGDALGLSNVTVSRIFSRLSEDGIVTFNRKTITLHDTNALRELVKS